MPSQYVIGNAFDVTVSGSTDTTRQLQIATIWGDLTCGPSMESMGRYIGVSPDEFRTVGPGAPFSVTLSRSVNFNSYENITVCAWVADGPRGPADAVGQAKAKLVPGSLTLSAPAETPEGRPVPITLQGALARPTYGDSYGLSVYVRPGDGACDSSQDGNTTVLEPTSFPAGPVNQTVSFGPARAGIYRACFDDEAPSTSNVLFKITPDRSVLPVLLLADDDEQRDRPTLRWRRVAGVAYRLLIYRGSDDTPVLSTNVSGSSTSDVNLRRDGDEVTARVRRSVGYGRLRWAIEATTRLGSKARTEERTVRIVPSPLNAKRAKASTRVSLRNSSRRRGTARLTVRSSPKATVIVSVIHGGKRYATRRYVEDGDSTRTLNFALRCSRTGTFSYKVRIQDPYGKRASRRGSWSVSAAACARVRAREAAKRRRDQSSSSSGPGTRDGTPAGTCADTSRRNFPVPPGDPRDGDGDGIACES
jgi:hypothetical protein